MWSLNFATEPLQQKLIRKMSFLFQFLDCPCSPKTNNKINMYRGKYSMKKNILFYKRCYVLFLTVNDQDKKMQEVFDYSCLQLVSNSLNHAIRNLTILLLDRYTFLHSLCLNQNELNDLFSPIRHILTQKCHQIVCIWSKLLLVITIGPYLQKGMLVNKYH